MADAESTMRFEHLTGRFFDGALIECEDQELAGLLKAERSFAIRFLEQARIERIIGYGLHPDSQLSKLEFTLAIERCIEVQESTESERFAQHVVQLVRDGMATQSGKRLAIRGRRKVQRASFFPFSIGIACAAALALALLLALSSGPVAPQVSNADPVRVEAVDLNIRDEAFAPAAQIDVAIESPRAAPPPVASASLPIIEEPARPLAATQSPTTAPDKNVTRENIFGAQKTRTAESPAKASNRVTSSPVSTGTVATTPYAQQSRVVAVISRITNVRTTKLVSGEKDEKPVVMKSTFVDGDVLRVMPLNLNSGDAPASPRNVDVVLADGSMLTLSEGTVLVFASEGTAARPLLERGEILARVRPQTPGNNLIIKTRQGAEAAVLGTVFTLKADSAAKRVELRVEEGKVQFSNKGEKRLVTADEICVADDGKIPSQPYAFRPRPAILSGIVTDKENGRPIPHALVTVAPYAERAQISPRLGVKTDAQGRFTIPNLREGFAFVLATTDEGGAAGLRGRGAVIRTRLSSGENNILNIAIDRGTLAAGKLYESGGKPVAGASVRLVPPASDGRSMDVQLSSTGGQVDWIAVGLEGAGKYLAIVDKPGFIARIRNSKINDLRSHLVTHWPLEVQLAPSAILKGRVINSAGAAITDPAGADVMDPRLPRTIVSLASTTGMAWSAEAEADGTFLFNTNLETGPYDLKIERFGYSPAITRINLNASQTLDLPIALELARPGSH